MLDVYSLTPQLCDFHTAGIYGVDALAVHYAMWQQADNMLLSFHKVAKGQSVYNNVFLILAAAFVKALPP